MSASGAIFDALDALPPGVWVVGVSGGADSVALLCSLVAHRPDITPVVAHLDHQTRGYDSTADADFVRTLGASLNVSACLATRDAYAVSESNAEAAYRAARLRFFRSVALTHQAQGVLLAHHADDRAETVLLRLLRRGEPWALAGLRRDTVLNGLRVVRPLLNVRRHHLLEYLNAIGQPWREDLSNQSDAFARNRVRAFLKHRPELVDPLLALADAAQAYRDRLATPLLSESFACATLADLPDPLARRAARRWLAERGSPAGDCTADVCARLILMTRDASTAARADFPGGVRVHRQGGRISIDASAVRS
jgi:tRNA(Ile)-lysidine synthase